MRKKILCLLVFLGLLCGCGASGGDLQEESKEVILNENGKEEIQIAIVVYGLEMQKLVGDYNAQSDRYEVVVRTVENSTANDFRNQIQLELSQGKGPDIMYYTALQGLDWHNFAEDGYLLDVTEFVNKQGELCESVINYNTADEKIYGVPYTFTIGTMVISEDLGVKREEWTKDYCMQLTENMGVPSFCGAPGGWTTEMSGLYVMNMLGAGMDGVQLFVDEEKGNSSFEQDEFVELLEFSKKHWDYYPSESTKSNLEQNRVVCVTGGISSFNSFTYYDTLFHGKACYIGYPTLEGGKYMMSVESFYVNAASEHKEGALDFLQFLLETEQQERLQDGFPARRDVLENLWERAKKEVLDENTGYSIGGVSYSPREMTDREEEIFWEMFEHNIYSQYQNPIYDIIYEEALPFFYGEKSAREVADIIDNRVQLYLDERK